MARSSSTFCCSWRGRSWCTRMMHTWTNNQNTQTILHDYYMQIDMINQEEHFQIPHTVSRPQTPGWWAVLPSVRSSPVRASHSHDPQKSAPTFATCQVKPNQKSWQNPTLVRLWTYFMHMFISRVYSCYGYMWWYVFMFMLVISNCESRASLKIWSFHNDQTVKNATFSDLPKKVSLFAIHLLAALCSASLHDATPRAINFMSFHTILLAQVKPKPNETETRAEGVSHEHLSQNPKLWRPTMTWIFDQNNIYTFYDQNLDTYMDILCSSCMFCTMCIGVLCRSGLLKQKHQHPSAFIGRKHQHLPPAASLFQVCSHSDHPCRQIWRTPTWQSSSLTGSNHPQNASNDWRVNTFLYLFMGERSTFLGPSTMVRSHSDTNHNTTAAATATATAPATAVAAPAPTPTPS